MSDSLPASPPPDPVWLARAKCAHCDGAGRIASALCGCVLRGVFRICLARFHACGDYATPRGWQRFTRDAEYRVDFLHAIERALDPRDLRVFRGRFVEEREPESAAKHAGLSRGNLFHACYRVEAEAARALIATGIYPPERYFDGATRGEPSLVLSRLRGMQGEAGGAAWRTGRPLNPADWGVRVSTYARPEGGNCLGIEKWPRRDRYPRAA